MQTPTPQLSFFYPKGLDLETLAAAEGHTGRRAVSFADETAHVLYHFVKRIDQGGGAYINQQTAAEDLGSVRRVNEVLDALKRAGVLLTDNSYRATTEKREGYSKYYVLAPQFRGGLKRHRATARLSLRLVEKAKQRREARRAEVLAQVGSTNGSADLLERMHQYQLQLVVDNHDLAIAQLYEEYQATLARYEQHRATLDQPYKRKAYKAVYEALSAEKGIYSFPTPTRVGEDFAKVTGPLTMYQYLVNHLNQRMVNDQYQLWAIDQKAMAYPSRPDIKSRVFNVLCNTSKRVLRFLRHKSQPAGATLAGPDVKNSQPAVLGALVARELCERSQAPAATTHQYLQEVQEGKHYQQLASVARPELIKRNENGEPEFVSDAAKQAFKPQTFVLYFGELNQMLGTVGQAFKGRYPEIFAVIEERKRNDYKALAIDLQRLEAKIMVDTALREVYARGLFALPVHDSFFCLPENLEEIKEIMREAWQQVAGLVPQIANK